MSEEEQKREVSKGEIQHVLKQLRNTDNIYEHDDFRVLIKWFKAACVETKNGRQAIKGLDPEQQREIWKTVETYHGSEKDGLRDLFKQLCQEDDPQAARQAAALKHAQRLIPSKKVIEQALHRPFDHHKNWERQQQEQMGTRLLIPVHVGYDS